MTTIPKVCKYCEQEFVAPLVEHKKGRALFCSRNCSAAWGNLQRRQIQTPNCICSGCGILFYKNDSKKKNSKSGLYFCNRLCKDRAQRIGGLAAIQPPHYGTSLQDYRALAFRNLPNECSICGYDRYTRVLEVHHLDGDHSNNSLSNLTILCPTCHTETEFRNRGLIL